MKKILFTLISGVLCASFITGCGAMRRAQNSSDASSSSVQSSSESSGSSADSTADTSSASEEKQYEIISGDFTLDKCIVLPEYDGMAVTNTVYVAGDDYVDAYIESLNTLEEVTDENAKVESGDTANIDYEGTIDGEVFEGGSDEGFDLEIGSGRFIDGFEEGLIGMKAGDETDLDLQFPEDYDNADYAGKDVVFHVVVNSISRPAVQDDDWVNEYTSGEYTNMDDFRAYVKEYIDDALASNAQSTLYDNVWSQVYDSAEFLALPDTYVEEGKELFMDNAELEGMGYGYTTAEEYLEALGLTGDDLEDYKQEYGENYACSRLLAEAILQKEGIDTDGEEMNAVYEELAGGYGMSVEDLKETYGEARAYLYAACKVANEAIVEHADVTEETQEYNVDAQ